MNLRQIVPSNRFIGHCIAIVCIAIVVLNDDHSSRSSL
ncbi:putative membrane protein [Synechococcus sp. PROS-9-1]|nr:putative membrane protein [Synechococcus sp. PROS-9-1]